MVEPNDGWQESALCRGKDVDRSIFFTDNKKDTRYKGFCGECPVQAECLTYALIYDMKGTWGGLTEKERSRIPKRNTQALRDDYDESGLYNPKLKV